MKNINKNAVEKIWDQLAKCFNNWQSMKPKKVWFTKGLPERTAYNRLSLLQSSKQAKVFSELTSDLNLQELIVLHTHAKVNLEQAQSAARFATLFNITIQIGFIVLINQLYPGLILEILNSEFFSGGLADKIFGVFTILFVVLMSFSITAFSHSGAIQAQDLKHLLELSIAKHNMSIADSDSSNNEINGMGSDLEENFISDF